MEHNLIASSLTQPTEHFITNSETPGYTVSFCRYSTFASNSRSCSCVGTITGPRLCGGRHKRSQRCFSSTRNVFILLILSCFSCLMWQFLKISGVLTLYSKLFVLASSWTGSNLRCLPKGQRKRISKGFFLLFHLFPAPNLIPNKHPEQRFYLHKSLHIWHFFNAACKIVKVCT